YSSDSGIGRRTGHVRSLQLSRKEPDADERGDGNEHAEARDLEVTDTKKDRIHLGYCMNWMVYRILPCVLMLVLAATPVARTICDISCSEHYDTSTSFPHSHHHHGDSTATSGAHLSPVA